MRRVFLTAALVLAILTLVLLLGATANYVCPLVGDIWPCAPATTRRHF